MAYLDNKGFTDDGTPNLRVDGLLIVKGTATIDGTLSAVVEITNEYVQKSVNYTLLTTDSTVECTSNSFTITLPTAVGDLGKIYNIKNSGSGVITINTTSSQTVDVFISGELLLSQYDCLTVQSNGTNWVII